MAPAVRLSHSSHSKYPLREPVLHLVRDEGGGVIWIYGTRGGGRGIHVHVHVHVHVRVRFGARVASYLGSGSQSRGQGRELTGRM